MLRLSQKCISPRERHRNVFSRGEAGAIGRDIFSLSQVFIRLLSRNRKTFFLRKAMSLAAEIMSASRREGLPRRNGEQIRVGSR